MSKHSPGPWSVCDDGEPGEQMLKVVGRTARHEIALCCTGAVTQDEETANARLIAAAPELLAELRRMHDKYVSLIESGDCGFWNPDDVLKMRAAISKAEGRGDDQSETL